jgi:NADPH-dependent 2,4-dienoyl-CoA reductase/sulfur reductase-like enzyme
MPHLLIIGGSDAGITAALRVRETKPSVEVTVVVSDAFPNYSICGLPFYLSGEVSDWRHLAHRKAEDIEREGIRLLLSHTARSIDPGRRTVSVENTARQKRELSYDKLIVATGATSARPAIEGMDETGVFCLRSMESGFALQKYLESNPISSATIVGGGYIGLEMADALTQRGISVTLVEHNRHPLKTVDASFGQKVAQELGQHGVTVIRSANVRKISRGNKGLSVEGEGIPPGLCTGVVLVATGARPAVNLAVEAGAKRGVGGAIQVNRKMETALPAVYAAGDCAETWHAFLKHSQYMPLGTTAHKQGRVAGENAVGNAKEFAGTLGTQVVKVFDLAIARTGLDDVEAKAAEFEPVTIETTANDHKAYYPNHRPLHLRITGDRKTGLLLGAQMLGDYRGEVAKRIDIFAAALFNRMQVTSLNDLDLSYTPPLGMPWDAVQVAAQEWERKIFYNKHQE